MPDAPEGFLTRRHRGIQKDRALLKRLEALVAAGKLDDPEGNAALRTHFQQLTEKFLVPLNRYFQTLVPPRSSTPSRAGTPVPSSNPSQPGHRPNTTSVPSPVLPPPPALSLSALRPFSLPTFLSHLKTHGPNPLAFKNRGLQTKSRVESDFYSSFCMGGCFAGWLAARVESLGIAVASMSGDRLAGGMGTSSFNLPAAGHEPESSSDASETSMSGMSDPRTSMGSSTHSGLSSELEVETPRPGANKQPVFAPAPNVPDTPTAVRNMEALSMN